MRTRMFAIIGFAFLTACGSSPTQPGNGDTTGVGGIQPPPGAVAQFTVSPIDLHDDSLGTITPLGNLNPPGHTTPSDHAYIYAVDFDQFRTVPDSTVRAVYAPADGAVWFVYQQPGAPDTKIEFRVTQTFFYYLDHVRLLPGFSLGTIVHAGEQMGWTDPGAAIDLGAVDYSVTQSFINPARYPDETLHAVTPWEYFTEPLRSAIYARQRRAPTAPRDAQINFDVDGTVAGNWYLQGLDDSASYGPTGWPKTLAFVGDYYDPALVRVAIGGTIDHPGVWTIPPDAPRPAQVTPVSGVVAYRLMYTEATSEQYGLMLLQLTGPRLLRVEVFPGSQASSAAFDAGAAVFVR